MTQFIIANIGNYPRIGEEKDQQRHRRGYANFENKEISAHAFKDVEQSVIQEIIHEQISSGLDEVTDGLISWHDPISHLCKNIQGIQLESYQRYLDANFYYRRPVFKSKPRFKAPLIASEYEYAQKISSKPVRAVLTGPYTLAMHSESRIKPFAKPSARLRFFTEVLIQEIRALVASGAKWIQIDEPSMAQEPPEWELVRKAFEQLVEAARPSKLALALYFAPLAPIYSHVRSWPVSALHLDLTHDPKKLIEKLVAAPPTAELGLGILDARSSRVEAIDPLLHLVKALAEQLKPAVLRLHPSAGLELLPRNLALAKLNLLAKIKQELPANSLVTND